MTTTDDGTWTEATEVQIDRVDLVATAANGTSWLIQKSAQDGLLKPEEVRALVKADGEDGDAAITSDLDVTQPLADDAENASGVTSMPGSPAWEQVDAATARKWAAILARAKNAVQLLADRERTEASVDPDGDDYGNAWDLDDAACAIDAAISLLAPYALGEEMEAEFGGSSPLAEVAKAAAGLDPAALETVELLAPLRKAGRVLSASNEAAIRGAVDSLQTVLASLPAAPEAPVDAPMAKATEAITETPQEPAVEPVTAPVEKAAAEEPQAVEIGLEGLLKGAAHLTPFEVVRAVANGGKLLKAKGDAQLAVFDENGKLIGTVDPADLSPIASNAAQASDAGADVADAAAPAADDKPAEAAAAAPAAEAPKAEAAPAAPATEATVPGTSTVQAPPPAPKPDETVAKAQFAEAFGDLFAPLAEQLKAVPELAKAVGEVQERLEKMAARPDDRRSPMLFGATGVAGAPSYDGQTVDQFAALQKAADDETDPGKKRDLVAQLGYLKVRDRFVR